MLQEEIYKELSMPYYELVNYLKAKYGPSLYDYFPNSQCKSKNKKVIRSAEGLFCHHIDEDKGLILSDPHCASSQPFDWQRKERLVYCNYLEHFILHVKISILCQQSFFHKPDEIDRFLTPGLRILCRDLNDLYMLEGTSIPYKRRAFEEICENYEDYITILKSLIAYISAAYHGDTSMPPHFTIGATLHHKDNDYEIISFSPDLRYYVFVKDNSGEERSLKLESCLQYFTFADSIEYLIRTITGSWNDSPYQKIRDDIINCKNDMVVDQVATYLKKDYIAHGFPEFESIVLESDFGANNADEYLGKALPFYSKSEIDFHELIPVFWRGNKIPNGAKDRFNIVRFETMFNLIRGNEPSAHYRIYKNQHSKGREPRIILRRDDSYQLLRTSDIFDYSKGRYFPQYKDIDGTVHNATMILTLSSDDFRLFHERYLVKYIKILDGCYFIPKNE